jgi:hypothetical protein
MRCACGSAFVEAMCASPIHTRMCVNMCVCVYIYMCMCVCVLHTRMRSRGRYFLESKRICIPELCADSIKHTTPSKISSELCNQDIDQLQSAASLYLTDTSVQLKCRLGKSAVDSFLHYFECQSRPGTRKPLAHICAHLHAYVHTNA